MSMGKSNVFSKNIMALLLNATPIANIADNAASSPATNLYVRLYTADPLNGTTEVGDGTANEATYGGYSAIAIARSNSSPQWTVDDVGDGKGRARNTNALTVPSWTGGATNTLTHFAICKDASGATTVFYHGALSASVVMSAGNPTATINANGIVITED